MMTMNESRRPFVPGMGVDWLLPLCNPFIKLLRLDRARRDLLLQADLQPGHRVLDIGCGTGSLVVLVKLGDARRLIEIPSFWSSP
jgi:methylase of polypeptide subunit release factors